MTKPFRVLVWHAESMSLFEVGDPYLADQLISNGDTIDVTDSPHFEELLKEKKFNSSVSNTHRDQ